MKSHHITIMPVSRGIVILILGFLGLFLIPLTITISYAQTIPSGQTGNALLLQDTPPPPADNTTCLACHGQTGPVLTTNNGELLLLYVPAQDYAASIHGKENLACTDCHTTITGYPHPTFTAMNIRDVKLQLYLACRKCHEKEYELTQDSVHASQVKAGNSRAAICTDCHTAHSVQQLTDPDTKQLLPEARVWIPNTCAQCHSTIYQKYKTSTHGSALIGEGNSDVPTCVDCHGVHDIGNPTTRTFRLNSPQMCAKCHTDPEIMDKYGISTQVLNTYVADFHGTTVTLFEKQSPDAETNKPVCYDCHGVHDIAWVNDPEKGLRIRENLLVRCQKCHPDANVNFSDAWLSHYIPSLQKTPMIYYVDLFYKILIPGVLGGMAILVALDFGRMTINRLRRPQKGHRTHSQTPTPEHPPKAQSTASKVAEPESQSSDEVSRNG